MDTSLSKWSLTVPPEYEAILENLRNKIIPEKYPDIDTTNFLSSLYPRALDMGSLMVRPLIIHLSGYALVSYEWVRPLAAWIRKRKCLEVMCGTGILSKALQNCGVNVIATDDFSWDKEENWFDNPWTDIERIDCIEAVEKYGRDMDLLICSWPYMDNTAYKLLLKMREINPELLMLYIGELGGATADEAFFDAMQPIDDPTFLAAVSNYKQSMGLHDFPMLLK